jgi:hypothetical protein
MKWLLLLLLVCAPAVAAAQSPADADAIRAVALDYIEGWYTGDGQRMERSLHPDLVKRIVRQRDGKSALQEITAAELVAATGNGGGTRTPGGERRADVHVLDVFGNTASVRVDAADWIDYMHLARFDGQWKIVNVLWETRPR